MAGTVYFKLGFAFLIIALIIHVVGYATTRWVIIDILRGLGSYHMGLWQICANVFGLSSCFGTSSSVAAWFTAAQILETLGVLGMFIAAIVSIVLLCSHREKSLRAIKINIILILFAGLCVVVGVIVFGIEFSNLFDRQIRLVDAAKILDNKLGYSFFLSAVGGGICLLVCVPLFVIDYRSAPMQSTHNTPVHYTNQGQVAMQPQRPVQPVYQTPASMPPYDHQYQPAQYVVQHQAYHQQPQYAVHQPYGGQKVAYSSWN